MPAIIADANIILRYLLYDDLDLAEKANQIINSNILFLPFEVVAEVVYVLEKLYQVERDKICLSIKELFEGNNIHTYDSDILYKALEIYESKKFDFVDTLLCGYSIVRGDEVQTFDKKINNYLTREGKKG